MPNELEKIFSQFEQENNEIPINQVKSDLSNYSIFLYGAGSAGIAFLHYLREIDVFPKAFIDGSPAKWGTFCEELPILSIHEAAKQNLQALVIVTINTDGKRYCKSFEEALRQPGHTGVHKSLTEAGFQNVLDYTYFRRCYGLFQTDTYNLPSCSDVFLMQQNKQKLQEVFELLSDDISRDVFLKIIRFRMLDDSIIIPTLPQDNQYFEYDIYNSINMESFVDCGAFNGITLRTFLKYNPKFTAYYALEPDKTNFSHLKEYVNTLPSEQLDKITLLPLASYDSKGNKTLYTLNGPGSFLADIGNTSIETNTIDNILSGKSCSFIKMNIEGTELPSLRGAIKTITTYTPTMAIAGYHKTWDLWDIPLLVNKFHSGYRVFLRSYMNHISFVYYFVPIERCTNHEL